MPLLLTVPCNDVPFHIPGVVLHALQADAALPGKKTGDALDGDGAEAKPAGLAETARGGGAAEGPACSPSVRSTRSGLAGFGTVRHASMRSTRSVKSQDDACSSVA